MIYVIAWTFKPENRDAIQDRFMAFRTPGGRPPEGVSLLGRWHGVGTNKGVGVAESDDPVAVAKLLEKWTDLMSFDVYPALNDQDVAEVIQSKVSYGFRPAKRQTKKPPRRR
jgi:hypothetical protein